ncbi:MAG: hypothetical protein JWM99_1184, partial [Verrucomicrobiales bacterium]|nr:hypothetical protein [Verrucomicrobiales bacterium]
MVSPTVIAARPARLNRAAKVKIDGRQRSPVRQGLRVGREITSVKSDLIIANREA